MEASNTASALSNLEVRNPLVLFAACADYFGHR